MTGVGSATIRACVAAAGGRKHQEGQKEGREGHEVGSNTLGEQAWENHGNRGEGGGGGDRVRINVDTSNCVGSKIDDCIFPTFPQTPEHTISNQLCYQTIVNSYSFVL